MAGQPLDRSLARNGVKLILFHTTDAADAILSEGFRGGTGSIVAAGEGSYAIAALGSDGKPLKYLPFYGEGWTPGTRYTLQSDPAIAWRFGDEQTALETADVMNATAGNSPALHVVEIDCEGPPLNLAPPRTL